MVVHGACIYIKLTLAHNYYELRSDHANNLYDLGDRSLALSLYANEMDSETEPSAAVLTGYATNHDQPTVEIEIVSPDFSKETEANKSRSDEKKAVEEPDGGILDPPKSILKKNSSHVAVGEEGAVQVGIEDGGEKDGKK